MKIHIRKIGSYLFDYITVMLLVLMFTFFYTVFINDSSLKSQAVIMLLSALIVVLFFTTYVPTINKGQTFGQKIMKLRVVNRSGKERTYLQSFIRECFVKLSCAPFFIIFSVVYFLIRLVIKKESDIEMPIDFILKTEVIEV